MLSSRGLCDGPIIHSEESYRVWCVRVLEDPHTEGQGPLRLANHEQIKLCVLLSVTLGNTSLCPQCTPDDG